MATLVLDGARGQRSGSATVDMSIRVVVVEDSPTARALLVAILTDDPAVEVVGEARSGEEAVALAKRLRPDVMTVDIHLPGIDGFEVIRRIMSQAPTPIVVVSDSVAVDDVAASMQALQAGALTALPKPAGIDAPDFVETSRQLTSMVKAMSEVKVVRRWSSHPAPPSGVPSRPPSSVAVVAVAASTGGPAAFHRILQGLPADLPVPVLIVQHIASGFLPGLVEWWNTASALCVKVATAGEPLRAGVVYVAPDGAHLGVSSQRSALMSSGAAIEGHRPSGNFLFESVAHVYGSQAACLILTGMGRDGTEGLRSVRRARGYVIAQDEESSIVFGMPGSAVRERLVDEVVPLSAIAGRLVRLVMGAKLSVIQR